MVGVAAGSWRGQEAEALTGGPEGKTVIFSLLRAPLHKQSSVEGPLDKVKGKVANLYQLSACG